MNTINIHRAAFCSVLLIVAGFISVARLHAAEMQSFENAKLLPTDWADGDSFRVLFPDGEQHTIRLYGADCIEWHVTDDSDARRLRAQRRYFGISDYGDSAEESINKAKSLAEDAAKAMQRLLAKPFTVHTAFADGGGDGRYKRHYGFITTAEGNDLATELVRNGHARAFGVYRTTPDGLSRNDYMEQLKDAELVAARQGRGAWEFTNWENLPEERRIQRAEEAEEKLAIGSAPPAEPLDPNTAARDELMTLPGIGEVTANAIIEARPFKSVDDLDDVYGIGPATLDKIREYLSIKK